MAAVGYLFGAIVLVQHGMYTLGGAGGVDLFAYWNAGLNLRTGLPIYGAPPGTMSAYLYPPPVAQLFAPLSLLPFPVVAWLWRVFQLACLRLAVGSWTGAGIAILVWPPVIAELDACNVHLLIAAAVAQAIRGRSELVVPVALVKFASLVAVPLSLVRGPRGLVAGALATAAVVALSFVLSPQLWFEYPKFLASAEEIQFSWYNLTATIPLWERLVGAGLLSLLAVRWARVSVIAAVVALPILWFSGLSILVALVARPGREAADAWPRLARLPGLGRSRTPETARP